MVKTYIYHIIKNMETIFSDCIINNWPEILSSKYKINQIILIIKINLQKSFHSFNLELLLYKYLGCIINGVDGKNFYQYHLIKKVHHYKTFLYHFF